MEHVWNVWNHAVIRKHKEQHVKMAHASFDGSC
jgi:hypothetical protein